MVGSIGKLFSPANLQVQFIKYPESYAEKSLTLFELCLIKLFLSGGSNSVVECNLAKVEVAGSNPVSRSIYIYKAA